MRASVSNDFRLKISLLFSERCLGSVAIISSTPITSIFAAISSRCHVRILSLTGDMDLFERMMHFILQHHDRFPVLDEIYYRCSPPPKYSTHYTYYYIPTSFKPPIDVPSVRRIIRLFIYLPYIDDRGNISGIHRVYIHWDLQRPARSEVVIPVTV